MAERLDKLSAGKRLNKRFKFYRENPALEVGTIIGNILIDCGLM